jgi:hypothetical protein
LIGELDKLLPAGLVRPSATPGSGQDDVENNESQQQPEVDEHHSPESVSIHRIISEAEKNNNSIIIPRLSGVTASSFQARRSDNEAGSPSVSGSSSDAVEYKQTEVAVSDPIEATMTSVACATPPSIAFDDRKRPLSVASTSSSSSSSLPRRYRKKFAANVVTSGFAAHHREAHSSIPSTSPVRHEDGSSSLSTVAENSPADWRLSPRDGEPSSTHFRFAQPPHIAASQAVSTDASYNTASLVVDKKAQGESTAVSNPSADQTATSPNQCDDVVDVDNESYVIRRVVEEIIETERSYVHDIGDIVNVSVCCLISLFTDFVQTYN